MIDGLHGVFCSFVHTMQLRGRRSLRGGGCNCRSRREHFQLIERYEHALPSGRVFLCVDGRGEVGIKMQNIVTKLGRGQIELPRGQLGKQLRIGVVGQRVFGCLGFVAAYRDRGWEERGVVRTSSRKARYWSTVVLMLLKYISSVCGGRVIEASA